MLDLPNPDLVDTLRDLIGRLDTAEVHLVELADHHRPLSHERIRLEAKANGVALARTYIREELTNHPEATHG